MSNAFLDSLTGNDWPRLTSATLKPDEATLVVVAHTDLTWFRGHFPGHPVLPGVVQTHWSCLWGKGLLAIEGNFTHIENLKFENIISPDTQLTVHLAYAADSGRLQFSYADADRRYSSGRIYFAP